jgi:uncharacterized integral membrane protein
MVQDDGHEAKSEQAGSEQPDTSAHGEGRGSGAAAADAKGATPEDARRPVAPTRISTVWAMLVVGMVLLAAILLFILQNGRKVQVHFVTAHPTLPLGVALLLAALLGALLTLVVGAARIVQLRRLWRARRRPGQR